MFDIYGNLQLFAEGGDGGAGAAPASPAEGQTEEASGVTAPVAGEKRPQRRNRGPVRMPDVEFGTEPDKTPTPDAAKPADSRRSYKDDIRKEYKQEIDEEIQTAVQGRVKNFKDTQTALQKTQAEKDELSELLTQIASAQFDIQPGEDGKIDIEALKKAVKKTRVEKYAYDNGVSDDYAAKAVEMEDTLAERDRELEARRAEAKTLEEQRFWDGVFAQAEKARAIYPDLNMDVEMQNPVFARMVVQAGVPVEDAYAVVHKAELTASAMQYSAQQARQIAAATIQAGQRRPVENGLGRSAPANIRRITDPKNMTREERAELKRRVRAGGLYSW